MRLAHHTIEQRIDVGVDLGLLLVVAVVVLTTSIKIGVIPGLPLVVVDLMTNVKVSVDTCRPFVLVNLFVVFGWCLCSICVFDVVAVMNLYGIVMTLVSVVC